MTLPATIKAASLAALAAVAALALAGCQKTNPAPVDAGVCFQAVFLKDGGVKFNKLSEHEATIENCAASLEGMRVRFAALGGAEEIVGAYQGNYIFLLKTGIFRSDSLTGARYPMLVRIGGGQLAQPGAVPQNLPQQAQ
ncbi:MAG: hypothetical protein P4L73_14720 [Caulobacteraceae bacterium]|nr:hypothetical protein [Caulobacteraceae bacterium]